MAYKLSQRSRDRMKGVNPLLVRVVERAIEITPLDFMITEGLRTRERQAQLVKAGASKTMNSRHITGHAIDFAVLVEGSVRWDWPLYVKVGQAFKQAASELGVSIVWGGDWPKFRDGPHVELDRKVHG